MKILEASLRALNAAEEDKRKMMDEWMEDPRNRMGLALFIKDVVIDGKLNMQNLAFIFLFGVQTGIILERSKDETVS
jgi:hypothetical protein